MSMEQMIIRNLKQTAVYWGNPSNTGAGYTFDSPVEIDCHWENKSEVFKNKDGRDQVSMAIVYVSQDVDIEGYLFLGDLADLDSSDEADPVSVDGAYLIERFDKIPSLSANAYLRKVYLWEYKVG